MPRRGPALLADAHQGLTLTEAWAAPAALFFAGGRDIFWNGRVTGVFLPVNRAVRGAACGSLMPRARLCLKTRFTEATMKLSNYQIVQAADEIGAQPVPEDHPIVMQLTRIYGDHTFFLDGEGLEIVEVARPDGADNAACVVKLASWTDEDRTRLAPHEPLATDTVVVFAPDA
jgi:hypothetical protein